MVFSFFQIKGQSMEPLLKEGDFVCASGLPYFFCSPREEELVVCAHPVDRKMLVKRIVSRKNSRYWVEGVNANEKKAISRAKNRNPVIMFAKVPAERVDNCPFIFFFAIPYVGHKETVCRARNRKILTAFNFFFFCCGYIYLYFSIIQRKT